MLLLDILKSLVVAGVVRKRNDIPENSETMIPASKSTEFVPTYNPSCFNVSTLESAKEIILTPEGISTEERWKNETPLIVDSLVRELDLKEDDVVLDYGCGIGRIAKELIERTGVYVVGVDASSSMRRLAVDYVISNERFIPISAALFDQLVHNGMMVDAAYSIWVLQHCASPREDIKRIRLGLKPGGKLHLVNNFGRAVPTDRGWFDDHLNIRELLKEDFVESSHFKLPPEAAPEHVRNLTFCATYEAKS